MPLIIPRRSFLLGGLATLVAAPAIIKIENLMPVKIVPATVDDLSKLAHFETEVSGSYKNRGHEEWLLVNGRWYVPKTLVLNNYDLGNRLLAKEFGAKYPFEIPQPSRFSESLYKHNRRVPLNWFTASGNLKD